MKIFLFLLWFGLVTQESCAFEWNQSVKKNGSTIYACPNDSVIFPYLYNLSESESIASMTWTYIGNDVTTVISNFFFDEFMTAQNYFNKVILNKKGNFTMPNVNNQDTGNYILTVRTQKNDQSIQMYTKELSLVVMNNTVSKGNNLVAKLSDKADWNSDTESLSLTCGDFIFKNGNPPINVQWITPDGSVKNSTKYSEGKFYLQLENPVKGGQYVCKIPEQSVSKTCATSNDNSEVTVSVNEDMTRIILLENANKQLEDEDKKLNEQVENLKEQMARFVSRSNQSCEDWKTYKSGKRIVFLPRFPRFIEIYCDQDTDGGRWNVFQRRQDGSVDFFRNYSEYTRGFGDPEKEFWLGLFSLYLMTNTGKKYELRFDLEKQDGSRYYAVYDDFSVGTNRERYAVRFSGYRGNAGDSFSHQKGSKFSTWDEDKAGWDKNCAYEYHGAWWYAPVCHQSNLNGRYNDRAFARGLTWKTLTGFHQTLKSTEMKFREKH